MQETGRLFSCCPSVLYKNGEKRNSIKCTLGAFLHLLLRPIFRQLHPNFINVRTAYASEIWAQLTKNLLTKSSTERFREYIYVCASFLYHILPKPPAPFPPVRQYILHLRPETRGMVHFQPVCQLMDNHIIHQILRQKCQPPVKI